MTKSITLNWAKKLDLKDFDSHKDFLRSNGGIYIWIFKGKPHRVTYVGDADNFAARFVTSFSYVLTGRRSTYDMSDGDDFVEFLRKHYYPYYPKALETIRADSEYYMPDQPKNKTFSFEKTFFREKLLEIHKRYLDNLSFAFAVSKDLEEKNIRKQVESILILGLRKLYADYVGVEVPLSYYIPIGNINRKPKDNFTISHGGPVINEIPDDICKITGYDSDNKKPTFSK